MTETAQISPSKFKQILHFLKKVFIAKSVLYVVLAITILLLLNPQKVSEIIRNDTDETKTTKKLPETGDDREIAKVSSPLSGPNDISKVIPIDEDNLIYSLSIDAHIRLPENNSLVRAVLVDSLGNEYLVYESYPLLAEKESFTTQSSCEESCFLDGVKAKELRIESVNNASIEVTNIHKETKEQENLTEKEIAEKKEALLDEKVNTLNKEIKKRNLTWKAGKTSFGRLSYIQKKEIFDGKVPNFQGAEFYKGGIFEITEVGNIEELEQLLPRTSSTSTNLVESIVSKLKNFVSTGSSEAETDEYGEVKSAFSSISFVNSWDWRNRHGADDPSSFYFDGDPDNNEIGNGWITSVKNQLRCGSCWAFAATGATEALANVYFNRHIDLDLSEQDALSCSGAGSCNGGWPSVTLSYYTNIGVVDEKCFPYTATDQSCSNKCSNPTERIRISGRVDFVNKTENNLKQMIIEYGPMSGGVYSWSHAMTLVGWNTDASGSTYWIFKNSWGKDWGDDGYLYLKTPISNIGWTHALVNPVIDTKGRTIRCIDADGDGYYNWGISTNKPSSCPEDIPDINDCDDSDPNIMMYNDKYECMGLPSDIYFNLSKYNFGRIPVGEESSAVQIEVGNQGVGDLFISDINILNTTYFNLNLNPDGVDNPCLQTNTTLETGNTCQFEVSFKPQFVGNYLTKLLVVSSDSSSPNTFLTFFGSGSDEPKDACLFFEGKWFDDPDRCFYITDEICSTYGGTKYPCDAACKKTEGCTLNCIPSCRF